MPLFKTITLSAHDKRGVVVDSRKVPIQITAAGEFSATVDEDLRNGLPSKLIDYKRSPAGKVRLVCPVFTEIESALQEALRLISQPVITEEPVIRYNIESHVSFAIDDQGMIFPNAGFPGARWVGSTTQYGDHHATSPSRGGYSMTVGAKAFIKRTIRYGENVRLEYVLYYRGGNHHGRENPAELLNAWSSFSLPDGAKEMPYSDEAALFFHRLLLGMADLSRRVQELTSDQDRLQALIARTGGAALLGGPLGGPSTASAGARQDITKETT
jgi:hypothetical protein